MGRPVVSEYKVKKAAKPNSGKVWYIIGRPNGRRTRAWFTSKEAAQAEATERNIAMRKLGQNAVALNAVLAETARGVIKDPNQRNRLSAGERYPRSHTRATLRSR